jgi:hypothetical protein
MSRNITDKTDLSNANKISSFRNTISLFFEEIRSEGIRTKILLVGYLLFIAGFFLLKEIKWHNNVFYALVLFPYILTIHKSSLKLLILNSQIFQALCILVAYLMATLLWSDGGASREYLKAFSNMFSLLVFFLITSELALRFEWFPRYIYSWICGFATIAIFILLLSSYHITIPPSRLGDIGVLRNAIQIGQVYGMIVFFLYFQFIEKGSLVNKWILYFLIATHLCIFFLTQSRGPLMAFYLTLLIGTILTRDRKLLLFLLCITVIPIALILNSDGFFYNLMISRSDSYRMEIYQHTMDLISKRIFFGHGILSEFLFKLHNGQTINHPHSLYLATWFYGGLAGLAFLLLFLMKSFLQSYKVFLQEKDLTLFILILYASICVSTNNSMIIHHPIPMYLFLWMPIAFLAAQEIKGKNPDNDTSKIITK